MHKEIETEHSGALVEMDDLVEEVRTMVGNPLSVWAVAATIESLGVRDIDAREEFGCDSVFDLAEAVYDTIKEELAEERAGNGPADGQDSKDGIWKELGLFFKHYGQGLLFSLPMLSQVAAVLVFRYSLWAWLEFNEAQATLVAFGTITAFIITGGFIQSLGRAVSGYVSSENYYLAYLATFKMMRLGTLSIIGVAVLFFLLNIVIPFYPQSMMLLGLIYMVLISLLLLAAGVLYALEQRVMILVNIVLGTLVVIAGMDMFHLGIYFSQWIGMGVTVLLLAGYAYFFFRIKLRFSRQDLQKQELPAPAVRYYINYRYFVYGTAYFLFLFLDRIMAWTAGPPPPPYIMWFNTPYELGMDWALISLVLSIAVLEYSVNAFSKALMPVQKRVRLSQLENFNHYFRRFYRRQLGLILVVGLLSIAVTFFGINSLRIYQQEVPEIRDFFANPMTTRVFWMAAAAYIFMIAGLLHTLFFFTLNRPAYSMYSLLGGLAVNFVIGYLCSRIFSLEYAAVGLIAGSFTFALISGLIARKFYKRLDFYYYSAY